MVDRTLNIFNGEVPADPLKASSLLAFKAGGPTECHTTHDTVSQLRQAQHAAIIAQAVSPYLDKESQVNLIKALTVKGSGGDIPDSYRPLLIPIPPASVFREVHKLIPALIKPKTRALNGTIPNTRTSIFQGASTDHNLSRPYVGSPHTPHAHFPLLSPWIRPYDIEKWPQDHHGRQGPNLPSRSNSGDKEPESKSNSRSTKLSTLSTSRSTTTPSVHSVQEGAAYICIPDGPCVEGKDHQQQSTQDVWPDINTDSLHTETGNPEGTYTSTIIDSDFSYTWSEREAQEDKPGTNPGIDHGDYKIPILSNNTYVGRVTPIQVLRCYASLAFKNESMSTKSMQQIYDISRDPEVCLSQACSFPRHDPDMGFTLHTLCGQKSCLNYETCQNNIESLQWINNNNLSILETQHKGYGLFAG